MLPDQPIGIFDSGVGGLTVANALKQILPEEEILYFGDTAHLPYGDKSTEAIIGYSVKISDFLLQHNAKAILIACNSASSVAYEAVRNFVGDKAFVFNVIDPVIDFLSQNEYTTIGLIGTKATVNSQSYQKRVQSIDKKIELKAMSTPLLVPMIEEGFVFDDISNAIIRTYLSNEKLSGISALILGCTHYPIIKNQISKYYNFNIQILDSAKIVAEAVKKSLTIHNMLCAGRRHPDQFFVSDYTDYFSSIARMFFDKEIELKKTDLW